MGHGIQMNQSISLSQDLSSDVDSLQFTMLKMREELIECKASKEFREAEMNVRSNWRSNWN